MLERAREDIDQLVRHEFPIESMPAFFNLVGQFLGLPLAVEPGVEDVGHSEDPDVEVGAVSDPTVEVMRRMGRVRMRGRAG